MNKLQRAQATMRAELKPVKEIPPPCKCGNLTVEADGICLECKFKARMKQVAPAFYTVEEYFGG